MTRATTSPKPEAGSLSAWSTTNAAVREALSSLLRSVGLQVKVFGSAPELFQSELPDAAGCLVLDIRLPGVSGLDFQDRLSKANIHVPIIFMTGHGDIPMSVRAMKAGAVDFLTKPFAIRTCWMPWRWRSSATASGGRARVRSRIFARSSPR